VRLAPRTLLLALLAALVLVAAGCGREADDSNGGNGDGTANAANNAEEELSGRVQADGSSTVGPLTSAAAELYREVQPGVNVTVGISGTGGGFERFCRGETDISNASRPIDEEEVALCEEAGIEFTELQVAIDALTVVVNQENDWAECMTVDQLNAIWNPDSEIANWSEVPDADFPDVAMSLAGPGTDSGTFDYFTDEVNGEEGASRTDYTPSEDDNVIVQAVSGDPGGLGYFGFTYYEENEDTLKAVEIDGGDGCVAPSAEAARAGEYSPLSRPLFIYVKNEALERPEVESFVGFFLDEIDTIAEAALFIPPSDEQKEDALATFEAAAGTR
jgi:phosphate transport system substrate-binding protein